MTARCRPALTPCGLVRYSTGSPVERRWTPWKRLGRNPLCHWRAAIGCDWPKRPVEVSTTKPGRFSFSLPRP